MSGIGFGPGDTCIEFCPAPPVLHTRVFRTHKFVKIDRTEFVPDAALASVIGEDELSETDRKFMEFGSAFEERFLKQLQDENRDMEKTLDIGWSLLLSLPKEELDRISPELLEKYYDTEGKGNL